MLQVLYRTDANRVGFAVTPSHNGKTYKIYLSNEKAVRDLIQDLIECLEKIEIRKEEGDKERDSNVEELYYPEITTLVDPYESTYYAVQ